MANIYLAGSGSFGAEAAKRLLEDGHNLVGVCSPATHRKREDKPDLLALLANREGLSWVDVKTLRDEIVPEGTDVILTAHSHAFIGTRTRARARYAMGYHPSLLPLHRGRDAVKWQARMNERVVGGSIYHLTNRIDGGPLALQRHVIIPEDTDASTMWSRYLFPLGIELLSEVAKMVDRDDVPIRPQDDKLATWEPSFDSQPLYRPELLELGR
jgi:methionyl-tRNA formyltransferase